MRSEWALAVCAVTWCTGCSAELEVLERGPASFVERDGPSLVDDGAPYRFVGYNAYSLTGCGPLTAPDDGEVRAFFASLRPRSVVRTYAFEPLGLEGVERVVSAARDSGHRVILVLTDHAGSCGEREQAKTPAFYQGEFRDAYLPWVRQVVTRYADDTGVLAWEPVKAARDASAETLRAFYDAVGGEIHGLDRNHLVHAGLHGPWAYGGEEGYTLIGESAGIDVLTFHDYDNQPVAPLNLESTVRAAAPTGKPVVLAEMGMFAGLSPGDTLGPGGEACIDWETRKDVARVKLDAAFAASLAGVLVWNWSPVGGLECGFVISENDPTFELVKTYPLP